MVAFLSRKRNASVGITESSVGSKHLLPSGFEAIVIAMSHANQNHYQEASSVLEPTGTGPRTSNPATLIGDNPKTRYIKACKVLGNAVQRAVGNDMAAEFAQLVGEPQGIYDWKLRALIHTAFNSQEIRCGDATAWEYCEEMVLCVFMALSPIAEIFKSIARQSKRVPVRVLFYFK
jgi:hypothetical protein